MPRKMTRWDTESAEFLDALVGPKDNPLEETEQAVKPDIPSIHKGGRPQKGKAVTDKMTTYVFRIRESKVFAIRRIAGKTGKSIRELMTEAVEMLISQYEGPCAENAQEVSDYHTEGVRKTHRG